MRAISFASWLTGAAAAVLLASTPVRGIAADSLYQRIGAYDPIAGFVGTGFPRVGGTRGARAPVPWACAGQPAAATATDCRHAMPGERRAVDLHWTFHEASAHGPWNHRGSLEDLHGHHLDHGD